MIYVYIRKWEESLWVNIANTHACRAAGISSQLDRIEETVTETQTLAVSLPPH